MRKEEGRRKKEEGRRKKVGGKIPCINSWSLYQFCTSSFVIFLVSSHSLFPSPR
jgi:hypothetical protein